MKHDRKDKALIFDIQRFSLQDGPGIRTTVFFKGCNLTCSWCHNPESLSGKQELYYDDKRCSGCGACISACQNVHIFKDEKHMIHFDRCTACGLCTEVCPSNALKLVGRWIGQEELIDEIEKDRHYYEASGGGVTLSGGECLLQYDFVLALIKRLKEKEINICIETNGILQEEKLNILLPYVDLFLVDYKLTEAMLHQKFTGKTNERLLRNLDFLSKASVDMVLRCPIIPGVNDQEAHLTAIAEITQRYKNIRYAELMPYHSVGQDKWQALGKHYAFMGQETVSNEKTEEWKDFIRKNGGNVI